MLEKVKLAMRIKHTLLDQDILETIESARAEMIRSGISAIKARNDDDSLITSAIKTYCLYMYAGDPKLADGYKVSWQYQLDNLRKSAEYRKEDANV